jgi:hypothetical protein
MGHGFGGYYGLLLQTIRANPSNPFDPWSIPQKLLDYALGKRGRYASTINSDEGAATFARRLDATVRRTSAPWSRHTGPMSIVVFHDPSSLRR